MLAALLGAATLGASPDIRVHTASAPAHERTSLPSDGGSLAGARGQYNLQLAFSEQGGTPVSEVKLTIALENEGVIYQGIAADALFFASLPRGRYHITAEHDGIAQTRALQVGGPGERAIAQFRWQHALAPRPARAG